MLVKFEEEEKNKPKVVELDDIDIDVLSKEAGRKEAEILNEEKDIQPINPTPDELEKLESVLQEITNSKFSTLVENQEEQVDETSPDKKVLRYTSRNG